METISEALKENKPYSELKNLWAAADFQSKSNFFLDLAIVYKCKEGVRLVGEMEGFNVYLDPYDDYDEVTPFYTAQLLSTLNQEYSEICEYMLRLIEESKPWNRRKSLLWLHRLKKSSLARLPNSVVRKLAQEFL